MTPPIMSVDEVLNSTAFQDAVERRAQEVVSRMIGGANLREVVEPRGIPQELVDPLPVLTSPPQGKIDGQGVLLASGQEGRNWHFRYNGSAQSPYRWEAFGQQVPLFSSDPNDRLLGAVTAYTTWAQAPSVRVPYSGEYRIEIISGVRTDAVVHFALMSAKLGAAAVVDTDAQYCYSGPSAGWWSQGPWTIERSLAAGDDITLYARGTAGNIYTGNAALSVSPIRVGG